MPILPALILLGGAYLLIKELKGGEEKNEEISQNGGDRTGGDPGGQQHSTRSQSDRDGGVKNFQTRRSNHVQQSKHNHVSGSPGNHRAGEQHGVERVRQGGGINEEISHDDGSNNGDHVSGQPGGGNEPDSTQTAERSTSDGGGNERQQ